MAKNYKLIPGENNNWEMASFLLIDHLYYSLILSKLRVSLVDKPV